MRNEPSAICTQVQIDALSVEILFKHERNRQAPKIKDQVSMAPSSRALLESTVGSFAYIAEALLKDPLVCPSFVDLNSPGSFENYVGKLHLSKFMWCKKYIDGNLLV
ncbi:hypothetical protein RvY_16025-2 [Ramazzottius varieornatus]|uniref:Uncharacterized protein n=1 Tax=Ramazzottius varieornatus TaxID=947166 RepID=A0A1D1VY21_RAMVA|nr:hypothetical protein RvY_16025-2 [Ramazzottius varieornatus]